MADAPNDAELDVQDAKDNTRDTTAADAKERTNDGPYAKLAVSGAHPKQQSQQDLGLANPSNQVQDNDSHLPQNRYHHHQQHQPLPLHHTQHLQHLPHLHQNASRPTPAYEASDASTPTRTRSTSSSTFTPLSTFPSSTSRAHPIGDNLEVLDNLDHTLDSVIRAEQVPVATGIDTNTNGEHGDDAAPDHVPFTQLRSYYHTSPQQQQQQHQPNSNAFLTAPSSQPTSLLASPQLCLRSRARRSGTAGASRGSASHSRSRNHSHSRRPSLEEDHQGANHRSVNDGSNNDNADNGDHVSDEDHKGRGSVDDDDDDAAESVDSHALAWDQTCLRIAYLVSTMVTPSANASIGGGGVGDADGRVSEISAIARNDSQIMVSNTGNIDANGAGTTDSNDIEPGVAMFQIHPAMLDSFVDMCHKGWTGSEPIKKRRKIAQIMHWQNEVCAYGKNAYCGCADGSPIPNDSLIAAAAPSAPAPRPHVGEDASICGHCVCPLTPKRPVVWVSDPRDHNDEDVFKRVRRSQEGAGDSIRKALKSFRGLVFSKKNKRGVSTPATTAAVAGTPSAPSPPTRTPPALPSQSPSPASSAQDKPTTGPRAWSQWEEINSETLRAKDEETRALYFPQTAMYHVKIEEPEGSVLAKEKETKRSSASSPQPKKPDASDAHCNGKGKASAEAVAPNDVDFDNDDDEEYDPDEADSQNDERNRLQETQARLRRAEKLLKKNTAAAVQTLGN
ncbi:hypothetical protein SEUCBS139899_008282 [Sporothrix eucalyptigena]